MNTRGFTLVELLAVIVILSLLALIASTSVTKLLKESKDDMYNVQLGLIKDAAETWMADNLDKLPNEEGRSIYVTLGDLKELGLFDEKIINPKTNEEISDDLNIKISTTINSYGNIVNNVEVNPESISDCKKIYGPICTKISVSKKNEYTQGDKYKCELAPGIEYEFIVLKRDGDNVNLIMSNNICKNGQPTTQSNLCKVAWGNKDEGPITAMNYLKEATKNWVNLEKQVFDTYTDEKGNEYSMSGIESYARLPYGNSGNKAEFNWKKDIFYTNNFVPTGTNNGYWLFTIVSSTGGASAEFVSFPNNKLYVSTFDSNRVGVRPVISVPVDRME